MDDRFVRREERRDVRSPLQTDHGTWVGAPLKSLVMGDHWLSDDGEGADGAGLARDLMLHPGPGGGHGGDRLLAARRGAYRDPHR